MAKTMLPKAKQSAETRERIVSASVKLFALRGFDGTSIDAIARSAGLTKGALYWHFANKDELFLAVLAQIRKTWRANVLNEVNKDRDPRERVNRLFENYCLFLTARPEICLFLQRAALEGSPGRREQVRVVYRQTARFIARLFEEGKKSGAFRKELDERALSHAIIGSLAGAELQCFVDPDLKFGDLINEIRMAVLNSATVA